ncbi:MAG: ABC transporter substrate-binding protein [Robiginitomaculum sp.]|nr:MAG: ABC transporter substrate-binding protein [Robiginitomaculum sp.]
MKRRNILTAAAALATGATTIAVLGKKKTEITSPAQTPLGAPYISKNLRKLRLVTSWPKDFPGLGMMPNRVAQYVHTMTNGRIDIKVFSAGELVGAAEVFDTVSTGAADMYHSAEYYWQGKAKGFSFFTAVPLGLTATEMVGWIEFGGGQQLWDSLSAKFNIKAIQAGNSGHQMGGWFKKEIRSLEDFKGLKMRMPGIGGEVIRRMGGAAVKLSGGEIYQALQSGAIDATEWVGPWNDYAFGFYREAPYYYGPGFHEPGAALSLGINLDIWNSFSASDKAIFESACHKASNIAVGEYTHENAKALITLREEHNIHARVFPKEVWDKFGTISNEVVSEIGQSDKETRKIFESYIKARNGYRSWTEISEGQYITARKASLAT